MSLQSHNGWPASKDAAELKIISVPIEGTKIKVRCAKAEYDKEQSTPNLPA